MLTALAALALSLPCADPSPEPPLVLRPPVVKFTGVFTKGGYSWLGFEASNPNSVPLPYEGGAEGLADGTALPIYRVQTAEGAGWKEVGLMFCKVAVGEPSIPAKGKVTFRVHAP